MTGWVWDPDSLCLVVLHSSRVLSKDRSALTFGSSGREGASRGRALFIVFLSLNLLRRHWLTKSLRFQVRSSTMRPLCTVSDLEGLQRQARLKLARRAQMLG